MSCSADIESAGGIVIAGGCLPRLIDELKVAAAGQEPTPDKSEVLGVGYCDDTL